MACERVKPTDTNGQLDGYLHPITYKVLFFFQVAHKILNLSEVILKKLLPIDKIVRYRITQQIL